MVGEMASRTEPTDITDINATPNSVNDTGNTEPTLLIQSVDDNVTIHKDQTSSLEIPRGNNAIIASGTNGVYLNFNRQEKHYLTYGCRICMATARKARFIILMTIL